MPTEKMNNVKVDFVYCTDPDHEPPTHVLLEPGQYKHTCPTCKGVKVFIVPVIRGK